MHTVRMDNYQIVKTRALTAEDRQALMFDEDGNPGDEGDAEPTDEPAEEQPDDDVDDDESEAEQETAEA
jgi:hypothetical protein